MMIGRTHAMTEPHFIDIGDPDDTARPLPIFITKQRDEKADIRRAWYQKMVVPAGAEPSKPQSPNSGNQSAPE